MSLDVRAVYACVLVASCITGCRDHREAQVAPPVSSAAPEAVDRRIMTFPNAPFTPHASAAPSVDASPPKPKGRPSSACHEDLAAFCRMEKCTSYALTKSEADRNASHAAQDESGLEGRVNSGTCGAFRLVSQHDSFSGWTQYFDAAGKLVGATRWSDTNAFCGHTAFRAEFGEVPRCP